MEKVLAGVQGTHLPSPFTAVRLRLGDTEDGRLTRDHFTDEEGPVRV